MPEFTPAQRAAIDFSGKKLLISAAAGSGKTRVLVGRVLDRIQNEGLDLEDFLIITFTRAAAAELRDRLSVEFGKLAAESDDRHLRRQMTASKDNITTIDAFCAALVHEYSHLTTLTGRHIASEGEMLRLREQARATALERIYASEESDLKAAFSALAYGRADRKFADAMEKVYDNTREHPYPEAWRDKVIAEYSKDDFADTVFGTQLAASARRLLDGALRINETAIALGQDDGELYAAYGAALEDDRLRTQHALQALSDRRPDDAADILSGSNMKLGALRGRSGDPLKERVQSLRKDWDSTRKKAVKLLVDTDECSRELAMQLPAIRGLFRAAEIFGEELERAKSVSRVAEFIDYSHAAVKLLSVQLEDGRCEPSAIAHTVAGRFKEVLIDEFQDTNEMQTLIGDLITAEEGHTLFMVGDVKQSIYRFRLARPEIFLERYNTYPPLSEGRDQAVHCLSQNFRSRAEVIGPINYFFRRSMTGGASEIDYDEGQYLYTGRTDPPDDRYTTEFCILDKAGIVDDDDDIGTVELEAGYVAERVAEMLREGFMIPDGSGGERPVRPEDIAILLRAANSRSWIYQRALENVGIPCSAGGDSGIGAELTALLSVLTAVDNPYLDVPLVGAMLSPVFGFTADELALIRSHSPSAPTIYASVLRAAADGSERAAEFVERLKELRRDAGLMRPDRFLLKLYAESGIVGVYSAMEGGAARRERLNLVYLEARRYSRESRYRLHGFVEYLEGAIERGEFSAGVRAGDGVRITSIHKSKGLEFAVVFVCSLGTKINFDNLKGDLLVHPEFGPALKIYDRARRYVYPSGAWHAIKEHMRGETLAEELRMLYVAMTRAREKLVLTCVLQNADSSLKHMLATGWLGESSFIGAVNAAAMLIPLAAEHPNGGELRTVAGAGRIVPVLPEEGRIRVHLIGMLRSDGTPRTAPMPNAAPLEPSREAYDTLKRNLEYVYPHPELAGLPSKLTATQIKGLRSDGEPDEYASDISDEVEPRRKFVFQTRRPRFISESTELTPAERGTALHTAMQFVDYAACRSTEGALAEIDRLEREKYLTPAQAEAVRREIDKVCAFATSDLCIRALASSDLRREFKFSLLDSAGRYFPGAPDDTRVLLQGVCDMFFVENGVITVVDFKSDRVSSAGEKARAEEYAPQLDAYARALARIFGLPVAHRVIYFFATGHAVEIR